MYYKQSNEVFTIISSSGFCHLMTQKGPILEPELKNWRGLPIKAHNLGSF